MDEFYLSNSNSMGTNSNFVKALTELSKSIVHLVEVFLNSPVTRSLIRKLGDWFERFAKKLDDPKTREHINKMIADIEEIIKEVIRGIGYLKQIVHMWSGAPKVTPSHAGRIALARHLGIYRPAGVTVFR